jgi:carbon storage regulator CsrA
MSNLVITRKSLPKDADAETRKRSTVLVGDSIAVTVIAIEGGKVKLAIDAPPDVVIDRAEVRDRRIAEEESWGRVFASIGMDEEAESLATTVPQL